MPEENNQAMDAALAALLGDAKSADDVMAVMGQLKKRALEQILRAEMDEHLGYAKHAPEGFDGGNSRNGFTRKRVLTDDSELEIEVPRDREGSFEPRVVEKGQRRLKGFDDKLIALYARGMSTRDIQGHIKEIYDVDIEASLVSRVTDQVIQDVEEWQQRKLDPMYPIVFFDGLVVKVRDHGFVANKCVHVVLGIDMKGLRQVLGLWITENEGAKYWGQVATELRNRGVNDILFACVDGLKGFPEAIEAIFPRTTVQTCIVHLIRNSLNLVAWKNRAELANDLRTVYTAATEAVALQALEAFESKWGRRYPSIGKSWRGNWTRITPFFAFTPELRRVIYTTNIVESVNRQFRKVLKTRGAFPTDVSVLKVLWLNASRMSRTWTVARPDWDIIVQQLALIFGDRVSIEAYRDR